MYDSSSTQKFQQLTNILLAQSGTAEDLRAAIRFHEYRYYVLNDPLIADHEYDILFKQLEKLEKANPEIITPDSPTQRVGNSLNENFVSVPHLIPMLSLDNSYNEADILDWDKRLSNFIGDRQPHYVVEPKYDGASISLIYEDDLLQRGATRGDGVMGDDITQNVKQIRNIPLSAPFSKFGIKKIEIRGEVMMSKENFKSFNEAIMEEGLPPLANPRNAAAGSLRMKDPSAVRKRNLEAVLYHVSFIEWIEDGSKTDLTNTHSGTLDLLSDVGFKTPSASKKVFSDIQDAVNYCLSFEEKRDQLPYEIDGMVLKVNEIDLQVQASGTSHHPRWAIAFKFKARQATSILREVIFQVSRTGAITPVAKIDPVPIGGVTVSSVSLFNESVIEEKDLRVLDTVIVERAGDVIPYIVKPLAELRKGNEQPIVFPETCPVCNEPLSKPPNEAVWRCININCEAQVIERIIHFVSKDAMDIRSLGEANVRRFYNEKILSNIPSIYTIDFSKIAALEGFKQKSIDNLKQAIETSKTQPLHRLIYGLGIRYVGEATAKTLASSVESVFDLANFSLEALQELKDIGIKVSETIHEFFHLPDNIQMLHELEALGVNMKGNFAAEKSGIWTGKTFLFTGTMPTLKRNEAEQMVEENGGKILSGVSKNLNYLVAGEAAGSKLEKARKIPGIQIIDEAEFLNMLAI